MIESASTWRDLVASALLGTERKPFTIPEIGDAADSVVSALDRSDQERVLLGTAAVLSLYRRAGCLPAREVKVGDACPAEDLPACNVQAGRYLAAMFSGEHPDLIPEWLDAAARAGKRAPDELLPRLLALGAGKRDLREQTVAVLGARGRWLASMNSDWSYAGGEDKASAWETGTRPARLLALKSARASDPALGREMLASTWASEPPEDRAAFLETFEIGLSMDDEPFLEEALDDRRKEVRRAAADLLIRLPQSRLCGRMMERAQRLVTFSSSQKGILGIGKKQKLEVTLPESCDKAMTRDGVEQKAQYGMGQKASWLYDILSSIPPGIWCRVWSTTPREITDAAVKHEWSEPLLSGWTLATVRARDQEWAQALLEADIGQKVHVHEKHVTAVLPTERVEALVSAKLPSKRGVELLFKCEHAWGRQFSAQALDVLAKLVKSDKANYWQMQETTDFLVRRMSPSIYPEAQAGLVAVAQSGSPWARYVTGFLAVLQFRYEMLAAIHSSEV